MLLRIVAVVGEQMCRDQELTTLGFSVVALVQLFFLLRGMTLGAFSVEEK